MKRIGLALIGSLVALGVHADKKTGVVNSGFEQVLPDGTPDAWFVSHGPGVQSFTSDKGRQGKGGRLRASGGDRAGL